MANGLFNLKQQLQGLIRGAWPNQKTNFVEYLVVAGGGSGAGNRGIGGGGGAGGLLQGLLPIILGSSYTVTIGAGGVDSGSANGGVGGNSAFGAIGASGGGTGGEASASASGYPGGSGGGGGNSTVGRPGGSGVFGQGNYGGTGYAGGSPYGGGGGGGAGTVGLNATSAGGGGNGGAGIASAISGIVVAYAGGGGGAALGTVQGTGGVGGGGAGSSGSAAPTAGSANTGGGGGADGRQTQGGNGGSGIVIISYPDIYAAPTFGGANSPTASTSGSGSMYFNNSGGAANQAVTYTTTSAQSLGAGDFCIEAFVWWSSSSGAAPYVATNYVGSTNYYWGIYQQSSLSFYVYGGANLNSSTLFTNNTWNHLVVCRTSGTTSMFLNGTRVATASDSVTYATGATSLYVGQNNVGTNFLNGYLSNFRIVVGNSIYSASATSITVPTAPFAVTSQTKVLLSAVSPNAYLESASALTPTLVSNTGSVSWNQLSPFATGLGYKNRVYTWTGSGTVTF